MSEELLAQLVDAPSPDTYLVYADALQDRGDPHGELIALSLRAEQRGEPPSERQRALEAEFAAALVGALSGVSFRWKSGFVDEITMVADAINATVASGLYDRRELSLVRSVRVRADQFDRPRHRAFVRLVETRIARGLTRLQFGGKRIGPNAATLATVLEKCPNLVDLGWCGNQVELDALELSWVERLALWNTISADHLARLVTGPWRLKSLVVAPSNGLAIVPAPIKAIVEGKRFPELVEFGLLSCGFENELLASLVNSPLAARLQVLALAWDRVKADPIKAAGSTLARVRLDYPLPATERESTPIAYWLARHLGTNLDRPVEALPHAELATRSNPKDYHAWSELGSTLDDLERDEGALHAYEQAIAIDPKRWYSHASRATALQNLGRRAEAEKELLGTLDVDPSRANDTYARLGTLYAGWNRPDDARAAYTRAIELSTDDADRRNYTSRYAKFLLCVDDVVGARAVMEAQRANFAGSDNLRLLDANVTLREGNAAHALELVCVRPAVFEGESRFLWFFTEAAALHELGRVDDARACYHRVVDDSDCPGWISPAWLGQTLTGMDPFAAIEGVTPFEVNDQIALRPGAQKVHDSKTHPFDRFYAALPAIAADALCGRSDRARARAEALHADCTRPRELVIFMAELVRLAIARFGPADAALLERARARLVTAT